MYDLPMSEDDWLLQPTEVRLEWHQKRVEREEREAKKDTLTKAQQKLEILKNKEIQGNRADACENQRPRSAMHPVAEPEAR